MPEHARMGCHRRLPRFRRLNGARKSTACAAAIASLPSHFEYSRHALQFDGACLPMETKLPVPRSSNGIRRRWMRVILFSLTKAAAVLRHHESGCNPAPGRETVADHH